MNILIAEQHPAFRARFAEYFTDPGYKVTFCADAETVLSSLQQIYFPLIILDISAPEVDALHTCQVIRNLSIGNQCMIIVTVEREDPILIQSAIQAGADDYVTISVSEELLNVRFAIIERQVQHLIRRKESEDKLHQTHNELEMRVQTRTAELTTINKELQSEITERKRVEATLRQLEKAVETMQLGVTITDIEGIIIYTNPADARMHGYTVEELVGRNATIFAPHTLRKKMSLEQIEEMKGWIRRSINIKKNGTTFPVYLMSAVVRDDDGQATAIITTCEDITESRQAEEALEEERNLLRILIDNLPDFIFVKDTEGRFLLNNAAHVRLLGANTQEEILGNTDRDIFPPELARQYYASDRKVLSSGQALVDYEEITITPEGKVLYLQTTKVPLYDKQGKIMGLVGIGRDITESKQMALTLERDRKLLAQRVEERTAELSRANAELARASVLKDEFLANMSHELRTPLNVILGMSEALQEEVYGNLNDKQRQALRSIEESGRHLLSLINDILDLSKIGAGKLELELVPVSVESICQMSLRFIQQSARKKGLKVSSHIDEHVAVLYVDERRTIQMLINLLSNAVKFTTEGGSIVLEVQGDAEHQMVHFKVSDTGIGIAEQDMKRLFHPFVQLDSKLSRKYPGTGLGLSLVYRMVELHGGSISVESKVGQGSSFTLSLPWNILELSQHTEQKSQASSAHEQPFSEETQEIQEMSVDALEHQNTLPPLILIAEDNEANIETVSEYLMMKGYRTIVARNGKEAIERVREASPDMILMDIHMPEMDGLEAIRYIRNDTFLGSIPIVAVTALTMPGDREKCLAAGADDYISKPLHLKKLVRLINKLLSLKTAQHVS